MICAFALAKTILKKVWRNSAILLICFNFVCVRGRVHVVFGVDVAGGLMENGAPWSRSNIWLCFPVHSWLTIQPPLPYIQPQTNTQEPGMLMTNADSPM